MSAAQRRRGADAERAVVRWLRDHGWPDTRRYLAGDGRQPGDIDWHPLICCEVKDVTGSSWPSWARQAIDEAPDGTVPVVVRRTRGVPDVGLWTCRFPEWAVLGDGPLVGPVVIPYGPPLLKVGDVPWMAAPFGSLAELVRLVDASDWTHPENR